MDLVNDVYSHLSRPGSGIKFIPFIQLVCVGIIGLCGMGIYNELAVPHMIMLIFLSSGLFVSLAVFDREIKGRGGWEKVFSQAEVRERERNRQTERYGCVCTCKDMSL